MTEALRLLESEAKVCTRCRLASTRTQVVFGVGDPQADLMLIGEAPGYNEDQQGEPFVGAAGQLLNRLLSAIGMTREDVYIANVIKCRPPNNRDPQQDEIDSCKDYLRGQIQLVDPQVVVSLGNFASKLLLRTDMGITKLRGRTYPWWQGRVLIPTYHPAAALRSGERLLGEMQQDFDLARLALEESRSRKSEVQTSADGRSTGAGPADVGPADVGPAGSGADQPEQMNLFA
ncbi:MAG: uracil-DNA glycosylase [Actinomycetota bacterium]